MNEQLQAIVTLLSLVNPAICAAMFAKATTGRTPNQKMADATRAGFAILVILSITALVGMRLLHLFGVSLDAFMAAGGGVLAWMGFSMLSSQSNATETKPTQSLTPLILFAASPGSITGVITLSAAHTRLDFPVTSLVAVAVATGITWLVMILVARFGCKEQGGSFLRDTVTRFMGLIVLAMGIQFALTGFRAFSKVLEGMPETSSRETIPAPDFSSTRRTGSSPSRTSPLAPPIFPPCPPKTPITCRFSRPICRRRRKRSRSTISSRSSSSRARPRRRWQSR